MIEIENATFEWIKLIVLGFVRIRRESGPNPRTIGLIRSKVAFSNLTVSSSELTTLRLIKYPLRLISDPYALLSTAVYGLLGTLQLLSTLE